MGPTAFTSPPKEGVLRVFFCPKNPTASAGCEPANLGTKGQHATYRPPKPLVTQVTAAELIFTECVFWRNYVEICRWIQFLRGTRWRSWLRHCATSRKVACSIPRSCRWNFSLTSFRPHFGPVVDLALTEMSTWNISLGGKGGRC